jgi:hypothetical protein
VLSGTPTVEGSSTVKVTVTDRTGDRQSATFVWHVAERLALADPGDQTSSVDTPVVVSLAPYATDGFPTYTWSATGLPDGLTIDSATGVVRGTPTAIGTSQVTVRVVDRSGASASVSFAWRISPLTPDSPGPQTTPMGTTVAGLRMTARGGPAPYAWRAENLPEGLAIDGATGVISGTTRWGTRYLSTVYVKDRNGDEVATTFVWNVPPAKNNDMGFTAPSMSDANQTAKAGRSVSLAVAADGGSNSGYEWRASGLPPGLRLAGGAAGQTVISGTATTPGRYPVTIFAQDSNNKAATMMFIWTVNP